MILAILAGPILVAPIVMIVVLRSGTLGTGTASGNKAASVGGRFHIRPSLQYRSLALFGPHASSKYLLCADTVEKVFSG
jgi:hypothetical protein